MDLNVSTQLGRGGTVEGGAWLEEVGLWGCVPGPDPFLEWLHSASSPL
jgi:hypothetical protein